MSPLTANIRLMVRCRGLWLMYCVMYCGMVVSFLALLRMRMVISSGGGRPGLFRVCLYAGPLATLLLGFGINALGDALSRPSLFCLPGPAMRP